MNNIESMTGFGEAQLKLNIPHSQGLQVITRIRSVNSRFLDIKVRLPKLDNSLLIEQHVRKKISDNFKRGSIECTISLSTHNDQNQNSKITVQTELFKEYLDALASLKKTADQFYPKLILGELTYDGISRLPGIFSDQEIDFKFSENTLTELTNELLSCVDSAILKTKELRKNEGITLRTHISELLDQIKDHSEAIAELIPTERTNLENKLKEKIEKTLELFKQSDSLAKPEFHTRLKEEASFYLDRKDVEEEVVRLEHHIEQFNNYLFKNQATGKQLEFILQEMFREINTLGNKIQSTKISGHVIEIKSILEKLKEQIANVE